MQCHLAVAMFLALRKCHPGEDVSAQTDLEVVAEGWLVMEELWDGCFRWFKEN